MNKASRLLTPLIGLLLLALIALPAVAASAPAQPPKTIDLTVQIADDDFFGKWFLLGYDYQTDRTKIISKINFVDVQIFAGPKLVDRFSLLEGAPRYRQTKVADTGDVSIKVFARSYFGRGDAEFTAAYTHAGQVITLRTAAVSLDKSTQSNKVVFETD